MANCLLLLGPLLLTGGILNYFLTPFFAKLISSRILIIKEGTTFYDKWIRTPVPFNVSLYVFDIKNPKEIMKGSKPVVEEIGPYVFTQTREKKILGYSADKETVKYMESKIFKFNRNFSIGDLDRHFVTANMPFLSTIFVYNSRLKNLPLSFVVQPIAERLISSIMEYYQQNLFINVTVDEIMFKGLHLNFAPVMQSLAQLVERFGSSSEISALSNSSFSFFKYVNNTLNGPFEISTGRKDISKLTQLKKYKEKSVQDIWTDDDCNELRGSDGIQFSPFKKDKSKLYVFTHELCRTLTLEYKGDSLVRGIKTYRYEPSNDLFKNQNNKCYCTESFRCKHAGVVDLSPCWYSAPIYASVPHFAGPEFKEIRDTIVGLKPDEEKHKSYLHLDPVTGATLAGAKRGQINTYIEKMPTVRSTRSIKDELFIPLFWYDESGSINQELEDEIKIKSVYPLMITHYFTLFLILSGSFLSCISCMCCVCCRKRKKKVLSNSEANDVYMDKSYEKLTNLDDAESTKTKSSTSSQKEKVVSLISNSNDPLNSIKKPGFIFVQPVQYDKTMDMNKNSNTHTLDPRQLALVPVYQHLPKIVNDQMNGSKFNTHLNSQFEQDNQLQPANYRAPSPRTLDESVKIISKLIELNSKNLSNDHPYQQDRSFNELTINQRKPKLTKQNSSQYSSFDD